MICVGGEGCSGKGSVRLNSSAFWGLVPVLPVDKQGVIITEGGMRTHW